MTGVGNGLYFGPDATINRGQMALVLYRLEGYPEVSSEGFADVPANEYYKAASTWAEESGIITGNGSGQVKTFDGKDPLTKEQACLIFQRYAKAKGKDLSGLYEIPAGVEASAPWAVDAVVWAASNNLTRLDNDALNPKEGSSRGWIATFIQRYLNPSYSIEGSNQDSMDGSVAEDNQRIFEERCNSIRKLLNSYPDWFLDQSQLSSSYHIGQIRFDCDNDTMEFSFKNGDGALVPFTFLAAMSWPYTDYINHNFAIEVDNFETYRGQKIDGFSVNLTIAQKSSAKDIAGSLLQVQPIGTFRTDLFPYWGVSYRMPYMNDAPVLAE